MWIEAFASGRRRHYYAIPEDDIGGKMLFFVVFLAKIGADALAAWVLIKGGLQ
jgi:hypothetical protein